MTEAHLNDVISRAHTAFRIGEIDLSEKLILSLGSTLPPQPSIRLLLGNIQSKRGRFSQAVDEFRRALEIQPDNAEAHNNLGVIYRQLGRLEDAVAELNTAVELEPGKADIHYNLGNAYKQSGDLDRAAEEYRTALSINPSFTLAWNNLGTLYDRKKDYAAAEEVYRKGLESDRNNPSLRYNLGVNYQHQDRLEQARDSFRAALKARPGWVDGLNNLGVVLHDLGENEESIRTFQSILRREPRNSTVKNNIGTVLHAMGNTGEAEQYFRAALADAPDYVKAGINLGSLLHESGSVRESYQQLSTMLRHDPDNAELRLLLARTASELGKPSESEEHLERILAQDPDNVRALRQMGMLYFQRGDDAQGEACFRKILTLDPGARNVRLELAACFRNRGRYAAAEREIRELLKLTADDLESWLLLAELSLEQEKYETAVSSFRRILELDPENYRALRGLARSYHSLGETQKAAETANTLVNLQGNRATPDDLSTLNDSLSLYEEVLKPYEVSFDSSWEESLKNAILPQEEEEEIPDLEQEMADERDSLLFYGQDDLDEYAPTLLDTPETVAEDFRPRLPVDPAEPVDHADPETSHGTLQGTGMPEESAFDPCSLKDDLVSEEREEDIAGIFHDASRETERPVQPAFPDPDPIPGPGYPDFRYSAPQAGRAPDINNDFRREPDRMSPAGPAGTPLSQYPTAPGHPSPASAMTAAEESRQESAAGHFPESTAWQTPAAPGRSSPLSRPSPAAGSTYPPAGSGQPGSRPAVPEPAASGSPSPGVRVHMNEPAVPEAPSFTPIDPAPEKPGVPATAAPGRKPAPEAHDARPGSGISPAELPPDDSLAVKEAQLLEHLLKLSSFLPEDRKSTPVAEELRLKAECLKARLLGYRGLKNEIERRAGFLLPAPGQKIEPEKVEHTFQYLLNLIESYPDPETSHALKTKVTRILERIRQRSEKGLE